MAFGKRKLAPEETRALRVNATRAATPYNRPLLVPSPETPLGAQFMVNAVEGTLEGKETECALCKRRVTSIAAALTTWCDDCWKTAGTTR